MGSSWTCWGQSGAPLGGSGSTQFLRRLLGSPLSSTCSFDGRGILPFGIVEVGSREITTFVLHPPHSKIARKKGTLGRVGYFSVF